MATPGRSRSDLLERASEISAVEDLLSSAAAGRGGCLIVDGPAGIGKTSVLERAVRVAESAGLAVRRAVGDDLESGLPFGMTRRLFADVDPLTLAGTAALAAPALDPGPTDTGPTDTGRGDTGRGDTGRGDLFPLLHGLHGLVTDMSARTPQLLVLDDVQWSDAQTLRFLTYLLNRSEDLRVGLLAANRSGSGADGEAAGLVARLVSSPRTAVHRLHELGPASVTELVRRRLPAATDLFCAAVVRATGGNPFLCEELLATVGDERIEPTDEGAERLATLQHAGIRTSLLVRLGQLGRDAPAVAAAVAVLGASAALPRVAALAALPPDRTAEVVDLLVAAEILAADGLRLHFVHPIIRETVYSDIGPGRRNASHRRAARLLLDEDADPAEVGLHVLAGDGSPDAAAVPALRAAAAAAMSQGAPGRAVELLRAALRTRSDDRARVLVELGRAEAATGDAEALVHYRDALDGLTSTVADAEVARTIGEALYAAGEYADAVRAFDLGLDLLEGADDPSSGQGLLGAQLLTGLYVSGLLGGVLPPRVQVHLERTHAADGSPSLTDRAFLCLEAGRHAFGFGVPPEAHRDEVAAGFADAALAGPELPLELGIVVLEPLALSLYITRRLDAARTLLDRLLATAEARGELMTNTSLLTVRAQVGLAAGDLRAAIADASAAVRLSTEFRGSNAQTEMVARNVLVQASLLTGDHAAAEEAVAVPDPVGRWGETIMYAWFLDALGHVALAGGDAAAARQAYLDAGERFLAPGGTGGHSPWRTGAARACLALGDRERAVALAEDELRRARDFGSPGPVAAALRCRALLETDEDAVVTLAEALDLVPADLVLEHASVEVDLGAALRRLGRRSEGREHLRVGLEGARACGAGPLAERAEAELEVAGARRAGRALTGPGALTPSERRVADLARDGLTNQEIAAALFVTRKTVEVHLSACYRKLGIRSREDLTGALGEPLPTTATGAAGP